MARQSLMKFFLILLAAIWVASLGGCMDPFEYDPGGPPVKTDPPAGPGALLPVQDALFRCEYYAVVVLDWTFVTGAQGYEFQVSTDSTFALSYPYQGQYPPVQFYARCIPPITTYHFRVRAYSDAWTWYTDWSEIRTFHVMPVQDDTIPE